MTTIMIVDDNEDIVNLFELFLVDIGHQVVAKAFDGEQAIEIYSKLANDERNSPEIVIVDYRMPGMDGLEVMDKILAINPDRKVIIISADFTIKEKAIEKGAVLFIEKPLIHLDQLENAIKKCVTS